MPDLIVRAVNRRSTRGIACLGGLIMPCGLGRTGRTIIKREGDGASPVGRWPIAGFYARSDRRNGFHRTRIADSAHVLTPQSGWCDEPADRNYNRPVSHPYPASAERLWRSDHLYDVIVVLDCNFLRRVRGRGSAIFLHLAGDAPDGGIAPTAGCVSLRQRDLVIFLSHMTPSTAVRICP